MFNNLKNLFMEKVASAKPNVNEVFVGVDMFNRNIPKTIVRIGVSVFTPMKTKTPNKMLIGQYRNNFYRTSITRQQIISEIRTLNQQNKNSKETMIVRCYEMSETILDKLLSIQKN